MIVVALIARNCEIEFKLFSSFFNAESEALKYVISDFRNCKRHGSNSHS